MSQSKKIARALALLTVIFTAWRYAHWAIRSTADPEVIVYGLQFKPFVYRALVPFLARILVWLGMGAEQALTVIIVASAIGLLYGIKYLLGSFRS